MQNKLQELTDKLYNEGLSKGKQEGEAIVAGAKAEAEKILAEAKAEAGKILAEAEKQAAEMKTKVESDVKMAARESISTTKQSIAELIVAKIAAEPAAKALSEAEFVKEIVKAVAEKFNTEESVDLALVLPASLKDELEPYVENELAKTLKGGVEASFSKKIAGGFEIGPKDGGYYVSLTDETFAELISAYLRPATKKILFG